MKNITAIMALLAFAAIPHGTLADTTHPEYQRFQSAARCVQFVEIARKQYGDAGKLASEEGRLWGVMMKHGRVWAEHEQGIVLSLPNPKGHYYYFASGDFLLGEFYMHIAEFTGQEIQNTVAKIKSAGLSPSDESTAAMSLFAQENCEQVR